MCQGRERPRPCPDSGKSCESRLRAATRASVFILTEGKRDTQPWLKDARNPQDMSEILPYGVFPPAWQRL